ncbi:hypothetical protein CKO28_02645 [Rhodovibrio sodomensis]|uniref:Uncharacterized protein n=1 Tax=Rhodovibrio sodomensis TaxID=1088 RepID=A0ABS1DAF8_9PROT|nr:hypothetical protein [Rhodovibrio sodomensis]MBK1666941.1 hypothetical protein [Rhodovibrio sodomensis]
MKTRLLTAAATGALLLASPLAHAGVPTFDATSAARAAQIMANTAQQVNRLTGILGATEDLSSAIGGAGQGGGFLLQPDWQSFSAGGDFLANLQQTLPVNLCQIRGCETEAEAKIPIDSMTTGVVFANKSFYANRPVSGADRRQFQQARENAWREAAISGYALAISSRDHLAGAPGRAQNLEGVINNATTLREDVQANSAALLALHQQLVVSQALMASMVQIEAMNVINGDSAMLKIGGAPMPPAARSDADYLAGTDTRVRVSDTERMTTGGASAAPESGALGAIASAVPGGGSSNVQTALQSTKSSGLPFRDLANLASKVATLSGDREVARAASAMNSAVNGGGGVFGLFAEGVEQMARSKGNQEMVRLAYLAKRSTQGPTSVERLIGEAELIAQGRGDYETAQQISTVRQAFRAGQLTGPQASSQALAAAGRATGSPEVDKLVSVMNQSGMTQAQQQYEIGAQVLSQINSKSGNQDVEQVLGAARSAEIDWQQVDTTDGLPWQEGTGSSSTGSQTVDTSEDLPWKSGGQTTQNQPADSGDTSDVAGDDAGACTTADGEPIACID